MTGKTTMTSATCSTTFGVTGATSLGGALTCTGAATFNSDVTVIGTLSAQGMFWVSGRVSGTTILSAGGAATTWSVARVSGQAAGVWRITFPAHPSGNGNYTVLVTGFTITAVVRYSVPPTSTYFEVLTYNTEILVVTCARYSTITKL